MHVSEISKHKIIEIILLPLIYTDSTNQINY